MSLGMYTEFSVFNPVIPMISIREVHDEVIDGFADLIISEYI